MCMLLAAIVCYLMILLVFLFTFWRCQEHIQHVGMLTSWFGVFVSMPSRIAVAKPAVGVAFLYPIRVAMAPQQSASRKQKRSTVFRGIKPFLRAPSCEVYLLLRIHRERL